MKTHLYVAIFLIISSCCKENNDLNSDPSPISFSFIITDINGNDLFFGANKRFDPYEVTFNVDQDPTIIIPSWLKIKDSTYFELSGFYGGTYHQEFLINFINDDTDTIKIGPSQNGVKSCKCNDTVFYKIYPYEAYFNNELICSNCSYHSIHKIIKK